MNVNKPTTEKKLIDLNNDIIHNFDVSIVMSFYKRYTEFKKVLPHNAPYLQRNGIEVIIVLDDPDEKSELLMLLQNYPFINWKPIINERKHAPRNHASVLNVGLKHATKKYILQIDPEVEFLTDIIWQMRDAIEKYPMHYILAMMAYEPYEQELTENNIKELDFIPWGNLMVERNHLYKLHGYDETFITWGGEDNNMRARLDMSGIKKFILPEAKTIHREKNYDPNERSKRINKHSISDWRKMNYPSEAIANKDIWGSEFNKVIYDWQDNQYAKDLCYTYLQQFIGFEIRHPAAFRKRHKKIVLCQAYNEEKLIEGFLTNMASYFDGIILLDDESTDRTWDLAIHDKILLKVKKKRSGFNDLENRNILLDLSAFFQSEWFCFMDIDERFDERFTNFSEFENNKEIHVVSFRAVYLWNDEQSYKGDIPSSNKGILTVYRMFRPIGHTHINTHKKLHFIATPYFTNTWQSNILFKDYGSMKENDRIRKYERYIQEDQQKGMSSGYDYLLNSENLYQLDKIEEY